MKSYRPPDATARIHLGIAGYILEHIDGDASATASLYGVESLASLAPRERAFGLDADGRPIPWGQAISFLRNIAGSLRLGASVVGQAPLHATLRLWRKRVRAEPPIVAVNFDSANYLGDENDGCYWDVAKGRRGNKHGWFVTVVVDSDTGGLVTNYLTDDGPYPSEWAAYRAGKDAAQEWCWNNDVTIPEDRTGAITQEVSK